MISDPFGFNRPAAVTETPRPEVERQSPMPRPIAAGIHRPVPAGPFRPATVEPLRPATAERHRPEIAGLLRPTTTGLLRQVTTGLPRPAYIRPPPQRSYGTIPEARPGNSSFRFADVRIRDDPNLSVFVENANAPGKRDKATQCSGIEEIRRSVGRGTMIRERD